MSPLRLRRYRAERVLREEFERLRARVLARVEARLRASGKRLDRSDLEECYAQAWQGLYGVLLDGRQIDNPAGWLVLVTYRRAIEEQRARSRGCAGERSLDVSAGGRGAEGARSTLHLADRRGGDIAAELDDRRRIRTLMEAMRCRLSEREREAASLCYLQGLSRRQAAARMGLSEARMRKLMDGASATRPGVAGKVGALVDTVRDGRWCEEQSSLMRALAFGVLDPDGERYRLALMHRRECPACRAYVASLRGLAAALPPALAPLRAAPFGLSHASAAGGAHASAAGIAHGSCSLPAAGAGGLSGAGTATATGAGAGGVAGASGGGWLLAGPLTAKVAVGCLLAIGIGAGCVELGAGGTKHAPLSAPRGLTGTPGRGGSPAGQGPRSAGETSASTARVAKSVSSPAGHGRVGERSAGSGGEGSREFTPEQPASGGRAFTSGAAVSAASARPRAAGGAGSAPVAGAPQASGAGGAAEREFAP